MKIKDFKTTSHLFPYVSFDSNKPVCVLAGASVFLHMMRCLLDGEDDGAPIEESKERTFVSTVNFEHNEKEYELCGVLCDDQSFFVAVRDGEYFSEEKTRECLKFLKKQAGDEKNYYCLEHKYYTLENTLSESDYRVANFKSFMDIVKAETENGDRRPIYIFNFFERLDDSVDINPFLDELASLDRQVFVAVNKNYPVEKMSHDKVQIVKINVQ